MAQTTLTPVISKGLFNADAGKPVLLSGSGQTADLVCDLSGCKDSIIMLVDIPVGGEVKNTIKFAKSKNTVAAICFRLTFFSSVCITSLLMLSIESPFVFKQI